MVRAPSARLVRGADAGCLPPTLVPSSRPRCSCCEPCLNFVFPFFFPDQDQSTMPEVKDLSEALPDTSMDPLTGVGVVASRNRAPTGYDVVSQAACQPFAP